MLRVGDAAPPIDAMGSDGQRFVLYEQAGLCTVIYFFPKAFTPGCTAETKEFRKNFLELDLAGASVVGVSTDDDKTQCAFADSLSTPFPIVADPDKAICRAYDVLWPLVNLAQRVTYIVGPRPDGQPGRVIEAAFRHELRIASHRDDVLRFVDQRLRATRPNS
jgi:thioredoxin-dependent peroxiredoxin